ncbi:MurR/RpiR family transcriptional regulator [Bacillus sp. REN10]|uniref:MurR/RpiR family transcriptional regulator n=1 Tax=Bacillus sp. REN10 TaxID=2782541 RepID=UPI00193BF194|nr:MurR/RpiR family transcriptional regulator [Bacillus sp. REN10]
MEIFSELKKNYLQLSKGQQKVGEYLLKYPEEIALQPASQIGHRIGVSETTVIRLCYSLGLSGYSQLQAMVREHLIHQKSHLNNYYSSKIEMAREPHLYAQVMEKDAENIRKTRDSIREEDMEQAVMKIMEANKVYITGMRTSFAPAQWLSFVLGLARDDVHLYQPATDDLMAVLQQLNSQSVFVAITFHRYVKETVKLAEMAKEQGAFVISITDSELAPIARFCDRTFVIGEGKDATLDVFPPLFSLLNALMASISVKYAESIKERQEKYERLSSDYLFFQ